MKRRRYAITVFAIVTLIACAWIMRVHPHAEATVTVAPTPNLAGEVHGACSRFRSAGVDRKRRRAGRTYSPSKVIHRWRGVARYHTPQTTVNNFGGDEKMLGEQFLTWLNLTVWARRPRKTNCALERANASLESFAPGACALSQRNTQNPSPASSNLSETNLYKCFHPAGTACSGSDNNLY
jgi:hypothetical protein